MLLFKAYRGNKLIKNTISSHLMFNPLGSENCNFILSVTLHTMFHFAVLIDFMHAQLCRGCQPDPAILGTRFTLQISLRHLF